MLQTNQRIRAIYENGVIRPLEPIPGLVEGQRYTITILRVLKADEDWPESDKEEID
jgi:predicted DNA-binding antitoxin AbrB/MazE fold protein